MGLDISKIKVTDSPEPIVSTRGRTAMDNPFVEPLQDSMKRGVALSVKVPIGDGAVNEKNEFKTVITVLGLLNRAAATANLGVRTEVMEWTEGAKTQEVRFQAKTRTLRPNKPAEAKDESAAA
jgi:hypothetical protein